VVIDNTQVPENNSAIEAICVSPSGNQLLQLARQLTAMALNCAVSGFGGDCAGDADVQALFDDCNDACAGNTAEVTNCINQVDDFNNGRSDVAFGCHDVGDQELTDALGVAKLGPAGSSNACNAARSNDCTVFSPAVPVSCP
jgi:hypothetical protein